MAKEAWRDCQPWTTMFAGVRQVARAAPAAAPSISYAMRAAERFALTRPTLFNADYWQRFAVHEMLPLCTTVEWAREGWHNLAECGLKPQRDDFLLLDLGDCPEIFEMSLVQGRAALREALLSQTLSDHDIGEFDASQHNLLYYNVRELLDPILSWNFDGGDYNGNDGYFAWLCVGALSLLEPMREPEMRRAVLKRAALPIVCGFEELFCPLALATPDGLIFPSANHEAKMLPAEMVQHPQLPF